MLVSFEKSDEDDHLTASHPLGLSSNAPEIFEYDDIPEKTVLIKNIRSKFELKDRQLRYELHKPFDLVPVCN